MTDLKMLYPPQLGDTYIELQEDSYDLRLIRQGKVKKLNSIPDCGIGYFSDNGPVCICI